MATNQKKHSGNSSKANQGSHSRSTSNNSGNFANMDESKQKEMASRGGKASHSGDNSSGRH